METQAHRSWRRYVRFSVRGLIVLVLVIGVLLGWIVRRAGVQRDAVAAIRNASGSVRYDWQYKDGEPTEGKPGGPTWLVDRLGPDYFDTITTVLSGPSTSDAELARIGQLDQLELLNLSGATAVRYGNGPSGRTHRSNLAPAR
jgi:hypothetical protein